VFLSPPDIVFIHDVYGNYIDIFQGKYSTINYERGNFIGKNITQFLSREDVVNILFTFRDVITHDFLGELEFEITLPNLLPKT
jgi:hypothetical protein